MLGFFKSKKDDYIEGFVPEFKDFAIAYTKLLNAVLNQVVDMEDPEQGRVALTNLATLVRVMDSMEEIALEACLKKEQKKQMKELFDFGRQTNKDLEEK